MSYLPIFRCAESSIFFDVVEQVLDTTERLADLIQQGTLEQLLRALNKICQHRDVRDALLSHPCSLSLVHVFTAFIHFCRLWWTSSPNQTEEHNVTPSRLKTIVNGSDAAVRDEDSTDEIRVYINCTCDLLVLLSLLVRHNAGPTCSTHNEFVWYVPVRLCYSCCCSACSLPGNVRVP